MAAPKARSKKKSERDEFVQKYGDLVYDLCESVLWTPLGAQICFRAIFKQILRRRKSERFLTYERPWVLSIACQEVLAQAPKLARRLNLSEQVMLDSSMGPAQRLRHIESYFHRLRPDEQVLLWLWDHARVPADELAAALGIPAASLALQRSLAIKTLADWILEAQSSSKEAQETILNALLEIPSKPLPETLKKNPLSLAAVRAAGGLPRKIKWSETPWVYRTLAELAGVSLLVFLVVITAPRIRKIYQESSDKQIEELEKESRALSEMSFFSPAPLQRGRDEAVESPEGADKNEFLAETDDTLIQSPEQAAGGGVKVGENEIWRLNFKSDSPREIRKDVIQILEALELPNDLPGVAGIEVPGGIQFNLMIPKTIVPELKSKLERMISEGAESPDSQKRAREFTWYRNRSRSRIPAGQTRVVIWISQI